MQREQWQSQFGFLLAAVGSAIGLGNIWRFSYMAYEYGGGAFLIPYVVALLTVGIPLLILEYAIGHERIGSAPLAYAKINRRWEWLGWWAVVFVTFGIMSYYSTIMSWCLNYFLLSFSLEWGDDPNSFFFKSFLKLSGSPSEIGDIQMPIVVGLAAVWFVTWLVVYRGVQKGIEIANKIMMPTLFILTAVLVIWSLNLEGASEGLKAYVTPDFSKLSEPKVWIDAYSQIFFTLSLGFGIMIAYASYLPKQANISRAAVLTAAINSFYSIFAGCAVFAVLGFMATTEHKEIGEVVTQSIGLAFVAYPKAISLMPGGAWFGAVFFLCLTVAGLSSAISIIEAFVSAVIDKFAIPRGVLVTVVCLLSFLSSILFTTQAGLLWLDIVDHFITHYGLILVGVLECFVVGWLFRLPMLRQHINTISTMQLGIWWDFLIKYFVPFVLGAICLGDIYNELQKPYGDYSWTSLLVLGVNWLVVTLVVAFILATRPWKTEHINGNGRMDD